MCVVALATHWDHNAFYHRPQLGQLPPQCHRVLDVGCGAGLFAARLAGRVEQVDAIDCSPAMIEMARQRSPDNVNWILADVMTHPLPDARYDGIISICALHHMNLESALLRFANLLRPGGVLAVIALPRKDLRHELSAEIVAALGHRLLGAVFVTARSVGRGDWFAKDASHAAMPIVMDPQLTIREVADRAGAVLPGVRVRRLVFWRYLLRWEKPT
ncbi:MAG TPA: class I SAM-dependent methyltransferase [Mycobacterium sp.]|uniref:class I SAM-dependent methyltransferase n=1 Tax=Mycobacterium sp. TaxID=1785 RepID=UPI002F3E88EF